MLFTVGSGWATMQTPAHGGALHSRCAAMQHDTCQHIWVTKYRMSAMFLFKRMHFWDQFTLVAGVCHRRVDAGAISSQAMPHFRAHSSVPDKRGSNGKSFLFPERTDKSAQVTPSLRDKAWANKEKARSRAQKSVQQSLPPPDSQYDLANLPNSKSIVPKRWPRGSKRSTTDLVTCMQNTRISGQPTQEVDDNDIEVLEHTGCDPSIHPLISM